MNNLSLQVQHLAAAMRAGIRCSQSLRGQYLEKSGKGWLACPLGAAYLGSKAPLPVDDIAEALYDLFPILGEQLQTAQHPCLALKSQRGEVETCLEMAIVHLCDTCGWSRTRIARWVASLFE